MRFLGASEVARMDEQRRNDILSLISTGREIEAAAYLSPRIVMSSTESPVDRNTALLASALKIFGTHDPIVKSIESRLKSKPGPVWRDLSAQEAAALSQWVHASDQMGQAVQQVAPGGSNQAGWIFLALLATGAVLAPILLSSGKETDGIPLSFSAPGLPGFVGPTSRRRDSFARGGRRPGYGFSRDGGRPGRPGVEIERRSVSVSEEE